MPSYYDNTYHEIYRKPRYDREEDKITIQNKRVREEIYEVKPAPVPTQQMENEYMDFLEKDLRSDPWITHRFRKYMAGPKRIPWKNMYEIKNDYKKIWFLNFLTGAVFFWPVACMIGRRMKRTSGGVPVVPYQRYIHDFPNLEPARSGYQHFKWWAFGSSMAFGFTFAHYVTDKRTLINEWYNRPDLKPYPAMVAVSEEEEEIMKTVRLQHYQRYQREERKKNFWRSPMIRFLLPNFADWTIKENPYAKKGDTYHLDRPYLALGENDFREHMQN